MKQKKRTQRMAEPERLERRAVLAASLQLVGPPTALFEGDRAAFTLRLTEPVRTTQRVMITTIAGTATYGSDFFTPLNQQIVFAPGQTVKTFSIATLRDAGGPQAEGREQFQVVATPLNAALGRQAATVTIADFVAQPVLTVSGGSIVEGQSGTSTVSFTFALSSAYPLPVTVTYATRDGTATTADADYVAAAGTLTFAPDELEKTVAVTVNGDRKLESDETFSIVVGRSTNATIGRGTALATIVNDEIDLPGFQVTLKFIDGPGGAVPAAVRTVAQQAVNRWSRIITGDLEGVMTAQGFIDDFEMSIQMGLLDSNPTDGIDGTLANARPTDLRPGSAGLPYAGITGLDPADIGSDPQLLLDTITHEMAHAFGFSPGVEAFGRWIVGDTFVGPNALREYNSLFAVSSSGVPLETGVRAHWDELVFGNELMSPLTTGAPEHISRVTIGALQDMGYTVSYAAAEPYVRPATTARVFAGIGAMATTATATKPVSTTRPGPSTVRPVVVTPRPAATTVVTRTEPTMRSDGSRPRIPAAVRVAAPGAINGVGTLTQPVRVG